MELHWRERRLANDRLLHAVTAVLGYPDPDTLCVAVADHVIPAARVAELLIEQVEGPSVLPDPPMPWTIPEDRPIVTTAAADLTKAA